MIALLLALAAADPREDRAEDRDPAVVAELRGDVKSFYVASFPYESPLFPSDPQGLGILDGRVKLEVRAGETWTLQAHHAVTFLPGGGAGVGSLRTGVAPSAPEAVPLTWVAVDGAGLRVQGRTDRLVLTASTPGLDVSLGRQAISSGTGLFFTPLDLVAPFSPAVIDQSYKPGVDALRVDGYLGATGRITGVAAYAGSWDGDGLVGAAFGSGTVGVTELGGFAGWVRGDAVLGATLVTALGPVGVHGDAALTLPDLAGAGGDPFARAVVGADWRPFSTTTLMAEAYVQTLGAADPSGYLAFAQDRRFASGELWLLGRAYVGAAWAQEIVPTLSSSLGVVANLEDPSALLTPSLAWSVADEATVGVGGFVGLGKRPQGLALGSEFGTYPITGFAQVSAYF